MMKIDILTLFPEMFKGVFSESIIKRAQEKGLVEIKVHNLRDWAEDKRGTVDDKPYGGGVGMVMMVEPIDKALTSIKDQESSINKSRTILLTPQGQTFKQKKAQKLAKEKHLIFICGHYEGVDERVREHLVDEEISIGDYVLTGGEIPAMVVVDSLVRLIPGVLEKEEAIRNESFQSPVTLPAQAGSHQSLVLLEHPQYTRPEEYKNWKVPEVLLSGNHQKIEEWQKKKSLERTKKRRPDLL
jgi:tRNA (guanine37-N1)-methyltransferase